MGVLNGIRVVDLSEVYQGPLAAQSLGDFGADVIKVERAGSGEVLRGTDQHAREHGLMSSHFVAANRNKRSIALDLKSTDDIELLKKLIGRADVLIHNYRPGVAERLGLGYEQLSELNPRLIYASSSGFGETGPLAGMGGQDLVIQTLSGMAYESASSSGEPQFVNPPAIDFASGMVLVQGILLALLDRERTGLGQKVGTCLLDTAVAIQSLEGTTQLMYGNTTRWFDLALNLVLKTSDGWVTALGFFRENPLALLCAAVGIPDASEQPHLRTAEAQLAHREEIKQLLAGHFSRLTTAEAMQRLAAQDLLCAPVQSLAEALRHPQLRENRMLWSVSIKGQGEATVVGNPLKLSRTPATVRLSPPLLDEHKDEVLEWLADAQPQPV